MGMLSIPFFSIQAYDAETTHPALTQEIIKLFEVQFPQYQFTAEEQVILERGSQEEDTPNLRCLAHFYDPIYEQGLYGNISAKQWAQATQVQAILDLKYTALLGNVSQKLFTSQTDFSFDRAVYEYVYGDKLRGLESLGHILHLIEDMAVPPHTRDDGHPLGSPYEEYAKQWTKESIAVANELLFEGKTAYLYPNLDDYFYNLALFTNQNFFSEDTILSEKYSKPIIKREETENINEDFFTFGYFDNNLGKLVEIDRSRNKITGKIDTFYLIEDENHLIFTDYWNSLSKQAVLSGAGVIKLFFDAVEGERRTLTLYKKNKSIIKTATTGIIETGKKTLTLFSDLISDVQQSVTGIDPQDLLASVEDFSNPIQENNLKTEKNVEKQPNSPQTALIIIETKPEDPNSPELQRLALILKEAEKMVIRLEKNISDLEKQNVGGTREDLVIDNLKTTTEIKEASAVVKQGGGGGGGGGAPSASPSSPLASPISQQTSSPNTTTNNSATTTAISPPQIISPENFSQLATTTITFSGTASATQIIFTDFSNVTTTVGQNNNWELVLPDFSQGTTTIAFFVSNSQATSTPTEIEIFVDSIASATPTPVVLGTPTLSIPQCNNSISTTACLVATTILDITWATTTPCADFAYFSFNNDGVISTTLATTTQITNLTDNSTHNFSVAVVDNNGNTSIVTAQTVIIKMLPVVINEIAWAGTDASATDEWIELYNLSDEDIDLSDWFLYSQDGSPNISFTNATNKIISAKSYYLIERTDDETIDDIDADLVTVFSGQGSSGLSNNGEHLILAFKKSDQATTTVDEVPFSQSEGGWPDKTNACSYGSCRTLEKYTLDLPGTEADNWASSVKYSASYDLLNGVDTEGVIIKGTPRAKNSLSYKISKGDILTQNKILTKINSPYFVGSDGLTINAGVILTIEPGVIIKTIKRGGDAMLTVNGSIQAEGEEDDRIIFTIFSDDIGGDTNGDGNCISGTATSTCPGEVNNYWSQIIFNSIEVSNFDNTIFRFGGNRIGTIYPATMVSVDNTNVNFKGSSFENSFSSGLHLTSAVSIIENCNFKNNRRVEDYNDKTYYGLYAINGEISIKDSVFDNNQIGLGLFDTKGAIVVSNFFKNQNNSVVTYNDFPLIMNGSSGSTLDNNSGENNYKNAISLRGYIAKDDSNTTLTKNPLPYLIENYIGTTASSTLIVSPGVVFKFNDSYSNCGKLSVSGKLIVSGGNNPSERVLFTSAYDDSDGTDMYNNGASEGVITGDQGVSLISATAEIKNAEFRYLKKALSFSQCNPVNINLENVKFENNTWSIYADNQNAQVTLADKLVFATTTPMSMNSAVKTALQTAKEGGSDILW